MPEPGDPLSEREQDVLNYLVAGSPNKEIAVKLHISPNTVKVHIRNIYKKLDASSRAEATRIALERRLVPMAGQSPDEESEQIVEAAPDTAVETIVPVPEAVEETAVVPDTPSPSQTRRNWPMLTFGFALLAVVLTIGIFTLTPFVSQPTPTVPATPTPFQEIALSDNWFKSAPLPDGRRNMAVTAVGLHLYLIGGETAAGIDNEVQIFDTVGGVWLSGTAKPTAVSNAGAANLFGEIFVPGGRLADGSATDVVEVYSPSNNAWRTVASLPEPIAGGLPLSSGSFLYLFGGENENGVLRTAYVYDINLDTWRPLAEMSTARSQAAGDQVNGLMYIVGGVNELDALTTCEVFDPVAESWNDCPPLLQARSSAGAAALVNKLYVVGGTPDSEDAVSITEVFDPQTNTWQIVNTPMNELTQWRDTAVTRVESRIYAVGGSVNNQIMPETYIYAPLSYRTYLPAASGGN